MWQTYYAKVDYFKQQLPENKWAKYERSMSVYSLPTYNFVGQVKHNHAGGYWVWHSKGCRLAGLDDGGNAMEERGAKRHAGGANVAAPMEEPVGVADNRQGAYAAAWRRRNARAALRTWTWNTRAPGWRCMGHVLEDLDQKHIADIIFVQEIDLAISGQQKDSFESQWYVQHHPTKTWDLATAVAPRFAPRVVGAGGEQGWRATTLRLESRNS